MERTRRTVFLVDGLGAVVSAAATATILFVLQPWFGLPRATLWLLWLLAAGLAAYSLGCWMRGAALVPWLLYVMAANLAYCVLLAGALTWHASTLTTLGLVYFVGEIGVIVGIVLYERRALTRAAPEVAPPPSWR